MCEVAAMREIHTKDGVTWFKPCEVRRDVCGGSAERLYVCMICTKEFLCALDSKRFYLVGVLLTAVVALAGIAFGIFIGKHGAHCFAHRFGNVVFGRDKFESFAFAFLLAFEKVVEFSIVGMNVGIGIHGSGINE